MFRILIKSGEIHFFCASIYDLLTSLNFLTLTFLFALIIQF